MKLKVQSEILHCVQNDPRQKNTRAGVTATAKQPLINWGKENPPGQAWGLNNPAFTLGALFGGRKEFSRNGGASPTLQLR